jgi:short-subunit dehydrogenase
VIKAVLPLLRQQGGGHILGVSSSLGHVTFPVVGYYCSSKWAFEAIHESLAAEIKQFGINVTIIEPGAYATEFGSEDSLKFAQGLDVYTAYKEQFLVGMKTMDQGDPKATPQAIFKIVDTEQPPLRLILGSQGLSWIRSAYTERLATWEAWEEVSNAAQA